MSTQKTLENLREQTQITAEKYSGLFAEYELPHGEFLLVHFELCDQGIHIKADFEQSTHFSGNVIKTELGFIMPFDPKYFEDLDYYLQEISEEISQGYLLPNYLYV